jgi:hypothetical protein
MRPSAPSVGDLWWVKEPFIELQARQYGPGVGIHCMVPGSLMGAKYPADIPRNVLIGLKKTVRPPASLIRCDSRAYLRIGAITHMGFHCTGHMQNIDDFLGKKSVAA